MFNYLVSAALILCSWHNVLQVHGSMGGLPPHRIRIITNTPSSLLPEIVTDIQQRHVELANHLQRKLSNFVKNMVGQVDQDVPNGLTTSLITKAPTLSRLDTLKNSGLTCPSCGKMLSTSYESEPDGYENMTNRSPFDDFPARASSFERFPMTPPSPFASTEPIRSFKLGLHPGDGVYSPPVFGDPGSLFPSLMSPFIGIDSTSFSGRGNNDNSEVYDVDTMRKMILDKHNEYRDRHGVSLLEMDEELNTSSQNQADYCLINNVLEHTSAAVLEQLGIGENISQDYSTTRSFPITSCVDRWYDEIKKYDFNNPGYQPGTGHFTQIVWNDTTKIGCGIATGESGIRYVVCQYAPAGNITSEHFENHVFPPSNV